jgi:CheY-like chemotaxis protein
MPMRTQPLRVLVVDDDVDSAQSLCLLLQTMGCEAAATYDGPEGLALADRFKPELAIIDMDMPGMKGREMVKHLRLQEAGALAMTVCLTGQSLREDRQGTLRDDFDAFVTKPIFPEALAEILSRTRALAVQADRGPRGERSATHAPAN